MQTEKKIPFKRFGTMIDCSRNAVMTVESVKKWIDICADLGYNTVLLYIEDTYEIPEEPFFGYRRGRYSQAELREMDQYAQKKGMELIPCIQTLAHLNAIVRWPVYQPIVDMADILLAGDDRTYELIDRMFASLASSITTRTINVGMDEAHEIGRGKYYDVHGDCDHSEILIQHVCRVCEIAKKYGFSLCMWSDMFFRLVVGDYYKDATINEEIRKRIPDNMELIYWDYYSQDYKHYNQMMKSHAKIKDGTWFAGGLWSWTGFAPNNDFSMRATKVALRACRANGIENVFLTMWGDNGGECSMFSLLPSLFYAAEIAKGNTNLTEIKAKFEKKFGIAFDRFKLLDMKKGLDFKPDVVINPETYLLYNDPFNGFLDTTVSGIENAHYAAYARRIGRGKKNPEWGYLFESAQALCDLLAVKAELGVHTRKAYASGDPEAIRSVLNEYRLALKKLDAFYKAYRKQWFRENKPAGFDTQDLRLGGLKQRLLSCAAQLEDYLNGKVERIDVLEEETLDIWNSGAGKPVCFHSWSITATANII